MADWMVRPPGDKPIGPVPTDWVVRALQGGQLLPSALACLGGTQEWRRLSELPEFAGYGFDDAATHVTNPPWLAPSSATARPAYPQGLGLPAPGPRPLAAGQLAYGEVDDEAETRIAPPPSEAADFPVDDETMTRVAGGNRAAEAPAPRAGVLPTLPMPSTPDFSATRADPPRQRPAAGAPAAAARSHDDVIPPTMPFIHAGSFPPPGAALPPLRQAAPPPTHGYPPQPWPGPPPPPYGAPYPPPTHYPPDPTGDPGLRKLVGLIVFLGVALAIVLILLLIRR
jgi:hypothetical protein